MNNNLDALEYTFWRPCKDGICYCDWRLTITHCYGEDIFRYINIVIVVMSALNILLGCGILYYRLVKLGQVIFEFRNHYLRPRAMEAIIFFMIMHNIVRLVQAIVLVTDTAQNIIARQFLFEFGYETGFCTLGVYFFGIVHALRESDRTIFDQWIQSQRLADVICTIIIVAPYFTNQICSFGAGINAYYGRYDQAEVFIKALYLVWCFHCFALASTTLFAGWRLLKILNKHILRRQQFQTNIDTSKVKLGATKVRIIAYSSSSCLFAYIGVAGSYAIDRVRITENLPTNLFFCLTWNGIPILLSLIISAAVILNPNMKLSLLFSSDQSRGRSHEVELDTSFSGGRVHGTGSELTSGKKRTKEGVSVSMSQVSQLSSAPFHAHTFDEDPAELDENLQKYTQLTSTEAAPTLSSVIVKKYYGQSPMIVDDQDLEFFVYPDSNRSSTQLVKHA
ncbi:hypothetical protein DM01DRAFT_1405896 [Hesseltinella vesiculosa]|uniref:G-protein coupled receptors family 1 profile domain-containing protein n=1 Tax=Hesseltinella vesiculosa TaxID=101127 RepID=A0A1X2GP75_9FUNG|nr:hypothetical protein DM01DRAFT_1405896 [Hesseltinella vesiculosa]